jgi:hypothetical protein
MRLLTGLAAVVLLGEVVSSTAVHAQIPLAELTQKMIRDRVNLYLNERADTTKEISGKVGETITLRGEQIDFEKTVDQAPKKLLWKYQPAKVLSEDQQTKAKRELDLLISQILSEYKPGGKDALVSNAGLQEIRKVFSVFPKLVGTDDPDPIPRPVPTTIIIYIGGWQYNPCQDSWMMVASAWSVPIQTQRTPQKSAPKEEKRPLEQQLVAKTTAPPVRKPPPRQTEEYRDDYPKDAAECFRRGHEAYKDFHYAVARAYLNQAVRLNAEDARFWYFKAFAELAMDNRELAVVSARRANALRASGSPAAQEIDLALQRLPDQAREFLAEMTVPNAPAGAVAARNK